MPLPTGFEIGSTINCYDYAIPVSLSDTNNFGVACRGLWVAHSAAATLKVTMPNGDAVTFTNIPAGTILPIRCVRVWSAGSTVTTVIALY